MRRPLAFFVATAMVMLVVSGCGSTLSDAATITYKASGASHETHVTRDDLLREVRKLVADKPFATWLKANKFEVNKDVSTDNKITAIWLSELIHQEAIDSLFASRKLHVSSKVAAQATKDVVQNFPTADIFPAFDKAFQKTLIDRQARGETLLASYIDTSDKAGEKYYNDHASTFACATGKNVAHILVSTEAVAQDLLTQIQSGASFATLAQTKSTDTGSGAKGGLLGCLVKGAFVPAFENAAFAAPLDTPVGPVKSKFGYHIILVTHATSSYTDSKAAVQQALAQAGQTSFRTEVDKLLKSFKVHLDARFGKWGAVTNQGQTVYLVTPYTTQTPSTSREGTTTTTTSTTVPSTVPITAP